MLNIAVALYIVTITTLMIAVLSDLFASGPLIAP